MEEKKFQNYIHSMASGNYSFEQMFQRSRNLESQLDLLLEILDEGVIGGLWFLALAVLLFVSQKNRATGWFRQPTAAFLLGYLVLSTVQFHGGEALMIFTLGCFLLSRGQWIALRAPRGEAAQSKEAAGIK